MGLRPRSRQSKPYSEPHPYDGWKKPDGSKASIRPGQQHYEHQIQSINPRTKLLKGHQQSRKCKDCSLREPRDRPWCDIVSPQASAYGKGFGGDDNSMWEKFLQSFKRHGEVGLLVLLGLLPQCRPRVRLLIDSRLVGKRDGIFCIKATSTRNDCIFVSCPWLFLLIHGDRIVHLDAANVAWPPTVNALDPPVSALGGHLGAPDTRRKGPNLNLPILDSGAGG